MIATPPKNYQHPFYKLLVDLQNGTYFFLEIHEWLSQKCHVVLLHK
jgi:hypothetical protein